MILVWSTGLSGVEARLGRVGSELRGGEGALWVQVCERVQLGFERLDALERRFHELPCAQLPVADQGGQVACGLEEQVRLHEWASLSERGWGGEGGELTVPVRAGRAKQSAIRCTDRARLAAEETVVRDHIPVTTVARTLLDLADVLPAQALKRAIDEAEYAATST